MNRRWERGGGKGRKGKTNSSDKRDPKRAERLLLKRMIVTDSEPHPFPLPVGTVRRELPQFNSFEEKDMGVKVWFQIN